VSAVRPQTSVSDVAIVALFGPTGVGKTAVAVELAHLLRERGEHPVAVSADALQVYEDLDVLAAKPSAHDLDRLEHRMLSIVPIDRTFSVAEFSERAHREIDAIADEGGRPIVVGGTGLYLRAALTELELKPPADPELRNQIERELEAIGSLALHGQLSPRTAESIHPNDRKRIVRALELERMGSRPYETSAQLWSEELRRPASLFGIVMERDPLEARIAERVRRMLESGALAEVELAIERGVSSTAAKAIGVEELAAHLRGEATLEEAAARIERRSNRYAKRQLTWMKKMRGVQLIDRTGTSDAEVAAQLLERLAGSLEPAASH
jgi:tRNA dimethylallyltransferase